MVGDAAALAPAPRKTGVHERIHLSAVLECRTRTVADIDRVQERCQADRRVQMTADRYSGSQPQTGRQLSRRTVWRVGRAPMADYAEPPADPDPHGVSTGR